MALLGRGPEEYHLEHTDSSVCAHADYHHGQTPIKHLLDASGAMVAVCLLVAVWLRLRCP